MKRLLLLFALPVLVSSCYYDNLEDLYPAGECKTVNLTYDTDIKLVIDQNCAVAGCHVAGTGRVMLTTYAEVKVIADDGRLRLRALDRKDMPPAGPLSTCEQNQLDSWLNAGALEK